MVIDTSALLAILQDEPERRAFSRFGKGRHPAGLNFGDCFAYALSHGGRDQKVGVAAR